MDTLSADRLRFDVLVLFHLCGDLTQPLHVGYGTDKGGNDYQVQYNGKGTNLHHIWDSEIITRQKIVLITAFDTIIAPAYTDIQKLKTIPIDFMASLNESRILLEEIYNINGHKLDKAYMQKNKAVVERQLRSAVKLLAACLEQVFSKVDTFPVIKDSTGIKQPENLDDTVLAMLMVPAEQAASVVGQNVPVCGKVYSAKFTGGTGVTFINMGGEYPNNPFTAVIMFKNRRSFTYKPEEYLNGKTICVTGTVIEYKGKPEIIVEREDQIKVQ